MARETVSISIRIGADLHQRLVEAAASVDGKLNTEIQRRLQESFNEQHRDTAQLDRIERQIGVVTTALLEQRVTAKGKR